MTDYDILKDIITSYGSHNKLQSDIAMKYHTSQECISELLQLCGFHNSKRDDPQKSDEEIIKRALSNAEVLKICEKLRG